MYLSLQALQLIHIDAFLLWNSSMADVGFLKEWTLKDWVSYILDIAHLPFRAERYKANYHEDGGKESIPPVLKVNSSSIHYIFEGRICLLNCNN